MLSGLPPVSLPDVYITLEEAPLVVDAAGGVLANDIDPEADPLTAVLDIGPLFGTLNLNPDGSFTYTPNFDFFGADAFTYHANDGTSDGALTVVALTVTGVNDLPLALPDAYVSTEDTPLTVNAANGVLSNDIDVDGDPLTAILDIGPVNGALTLNPDGSFTYTPALNFFGVDTFTYHANDGNTDSLPTVVTLTIASVNDAPPVSLPDVYTESEDNVLTVNAANGVLANDLDIDGDPLTAILDIGPLFGSLTLNPDGSFVYTPDANSFGVDTFTYHANDGTADGVPAVVTLTILSVNDIPVALPDAYAASEDTPLTVNAANGVLSNDIDLDGDPLTAVLDIGPLNGSLTLNPDGSFTYTPNANFFGVDTFIYHANDGSSNSPPAVVALTVAGVNDAPPVALPDAYGVSEDSVLTVNAANGVLANDTDIDGDPLTAILDINPLFGALTLNSDGSFTYTPNANFFGIDTFTYHANDGTADSLPTVVTLTIAGVNDAPPVALPDAYAATEDTVLTVNAANGVLANDTDIDGDPLTAVLDIGPLNGSLTLNPDGSFTYTPNANFFGVDTFIYHANDGASNSPPAVVVLTVTGVNDAPPVALPDAYATAEDSVLTVNTANGVLANDIDIDGDPLTAILDVGPLNGSLTLNPDGSFTYTPNANFFGVDTFTYHANDGTADSPPAVVTLTLIGVNDAPPVAVPDAYAATEDTVLTVSAANGVLANDTDIDGDPLTAVLDFGPLNGTLVLNANGSFTYTPNANFNGVDTFLYHANDGTANSPPALVTLVVSSVNDAPPVAVPDAYSSPEDTVLTVSAANGVLANDTDIDGDALTAILDVGPTNGTVTLNPNGSFTYTPNASFNGVDTFTYHANDGTANSAPTVVTLTITGVNDAPPVAVADAYATNEDTTLTVTAANGVLANDTDIDGDPLTAVLDIGPLNGTLTLNSNGSFTYTPNANFNGVDSFIYHANDGTSNSPPASVTLTVAAVADGPPVATADAYTGAEDAVLIVGAANGVLANDTDPDGDALTAILETGPANGTLTLDADGSFVYAPDADFTGTDTFTYHANDGTSNSNTVTVTLTITDANDPPTSANDAYFINEDAVLTVGAANGVLVNDTDPDGDPLTATVVTPPTNGTVVLSADGSFVYTPNSDFNGTDSFTYRANDGTEDGNVATVTITVNSQNEAPIIITSPGSQSARKHKRVVLDPAINLIDPDSPNFGGGNLDIAIQSGAGSKDFLGYRKGGAKKGLVNAKRGQLRIGRTVIGSLTGGKRGSPVHIEYNSNATQERVELAMQNLIFRGTGKQPGPRAVSWQITDETSLDSNVATKSVDVT